MPSVRRPLPLHLLAFASLGLLALAVTWPLPLYWNSAFLGPTSGDLGVYIWNLWLFRHEITVDHAFPLFTDEVLGLSAPVALSLHNYTLFADILAFPLLGFLGLPATFNLVQVLLSAFSAWAMFLLARSITGRNAEAWLAGALFAFSPVFTARSVAHASLASAGPLPLFVLALERIRRHQRLRDAVIAGACAGWASTWDVYYGVFCLLLTAAYGLIVMCRVQPAATDTPRRSTRAIDAALGVLAAIIILTLASGGTEFTLLGLRVRLDTLYTPVLLLTVGLAARWWLVKRPGLEWSLPPRRLMFTQLAAAGFACAVVLAPQLFGLARALMNGASFHGPIYWRSSPPGLDLISFFLPNPEHAWLGSASAEWLAARPNGYPENTGSLSLVAMAVVLVAVVACRFRPDRLWGGLTLFFFSLALGPFIHVAGVNTFIPTPWTLLRFVPLVTATRTPTRYVIPLAMFFALLFAMALVRLSTRYARFRPALLTLTAALLIAELIPESRQLHPARAPEILKVIADDKRDVRVLTLPFGVRSGEWSSGNFQSSTLYFQTFHEKGLLGGYLSRVAPRHLTRVKESRELWSLMDLSEGRGLLSRDPARARQNAAAFIAANRIGYVIIDTKMVKPELRKFAIDLFGLSRIASSDGYDLFVPPGPGTRPPQVPGATLPNRQVNYRPGAL